MKTEKAVAWEWEIRSKTSWLGSGFRELLAYRDLLQRLVRKEFLLRYQQTLLGPVWVVIQPLLTVFVYVLVFNRVIGIPTDGVPPVLFYLAGITLWGLFSDIFMGTSATITYNADVFQKVYFPRLVVPLSLAGLHFIRFLIQLSLLLIMLAYFYFTGKTDVSLYRFFYAIPVFIVIMGTAMGGGLLFAILTTKYRDLSNILGMINSMLMFICPIFYPLAMVPEKIRWLVNINPLSAQFEMFRYAFLGKGTFEPGQVLYSFTFMLFILAAGILVFNKKCDELIDVV